MRTTFKSFSKGDGLTIFDIDETLMHTFANVLVRDKNSGEVIHVLSNREFNGHTLSADQEYDFSEFADASLFRKTSTPIKEVLDRMKYVIDIIEQANARDSKVLLLTARGKFDDHTEFLKTFADLGVRIDKIDVITAGSAKAKKQHIDTLLATNKFTRVRMYDDHPPNLDDFLALQDKYTNINFKAFIVKNGKFTQY